MPITEETSTAAASGAYGKSKLAVEMMLHDYHAACIKIGRPMGLVGVHTLVVQNLKLWLQHFRPCFVILMLLGATEEVYLAR